MTILGAVYYRLPSLLIVVVWQSQHFFDMMAEDGKETAIGGGIRRSDVASLVGELER